MKIEAWTDIVCPWCYIGKRRLERALALFERRAEVEVVWRSFELDPSAPRQYPGTTDDLLVARYGMSRAQAEAAHARITALAAQDGLEYRFDLARPGNSRDAHRLVHLAATDGLDGAMEERLMRGYFTEGVPIGDRDALVRLASEVGLDAETARATLESDAYVDEVRADQARAVSLGFRGVPAFLVEGRYAVSGAERAEVLLGAMERAVR